MLRMIKKSLAPFEALTMYKNFILAWFWEVEVSLSLQITTGLPLLNNKEKWESLPEALLMKTVYPSTSPLSGSLMSKLPERSMIL
jgi:hypothetical protein